MDSKAQFLLALGLIVSVFLLGWGVVRFLAARWKNSQPSNDASWWVDLARSQTDQAKLKEVEYRQLFELYQTLMEHVPRGLFVLDMDFKPIFKNSFMDLIWPDQQMAPDFLSSTMTEVFEKKKWGEESRIVHQGRIYDLQMFDMPRDQVLGMLTDVTDQVRRSEQDKAKRDLQMLGEMASGIAHEVKNGLAVIQGAVQMLDIQGPDGDLLRNEVDRLLKMVRLLMRSSRHKPLDSYPFDLQTWMQDELNLAQKRYPQRVIKEVCERPGEVLGDPDQLSLVIQNLIANGLESSESAEVKIVFWVHESSWGFSVEDSGPGFSQDALNKLFVPFVSSKSGGHGLGLFQCRTLVHAHGGQMEVQAKPAKITCTFNHRESHG